MAVQTRTIKRRIKSVTNTKKITKAMELVAASKMRKAINAVLDTKPYAELAWDTVQTIGAKVESTHPMLQEPEEASDVLMLLLTSDRGLAGGFNTHVVKKVLETIHDYESGTTLKTICVGRKGAIAMRKHNIDILAQFESLSDNVGMEDVLPVVRMLRTEFSTGTYKRVVVAYMDFESALRQEPVVIQLLPFTSQEATRKIGELEEEAKEAQLSFAHAPEYTFEPNAEAVLNEMLPRLLETMTYQAVLESAASEHSSRMMAMKNASDAAGDMIEDLTFQFNQARQASITREIAEISSGKAALE